jgi:hypothetical protein
LVVVEHLPEGSSDSGVHPIANRLLSRQARPKTAGVGFADRFADRKPLVFCQGRYGALQSTDFVASLWPLDIHY